MMDVSGSMTEFKKYIARSFYFWMVRFLRTKYDNVEIVFISHHTEAREVTEEQFFTQGESGGTVVSSAYLLALEIISKRIDPAPGTHKIKYHSPIDDIEITHTAHNRVGFASGAVLAAEFITDKKGIFEMKDVLGL